MLREDFFLESLGYTIISVTADGLPGLPLIFGTIPFQYCHFHAKKGITKYTTRNPKTQAGLELKLIMDNIKGYTHGSFVKEIEEWKIYHTLFLKEKTDHPNGRWSYTHRRLRSAINAMMRMSPYLFTYQKVNFFVPQTTNTLEGFFGHLKVRVCVHRGISLQRKQKMISLILLNSSTQYLKDMHKKLF